VGALQNNSTARRLKRIGYEGDIEFCLAEDTVPVVPRLVGDAFVGGLQGPGGPAKLRPGGQHKKPRFLLDKEMARHYPGVSEGGSNVTSSVESATGRR
jgi:hypothetical protein